MESMYVTGCLLEGMSLCCLGATDKGVSLMVMNMNCFPVTAM